MPIWSRLLLVLNLLLCTLEAIGAQCVNGDIDYTSTTPGLPKLHMQVFYPGDNARLSAENVQVAARLAQKDINKDGSGILDNYELVLQFSDTLCLPSEATWQLVQATSFSSNSTNWAMFIGGACSLSTQPITYISSELYGLTQISYGATSPALGDAGNFFATIPSESHSNKLKCAMMRRYNWRKVGVLYEAEDIYAKTVGDFRMSCNDSENNRTYNYSTRSFVDNPRIALEQLSGPDEDIRIIFGWFNKVHAPNVICQANELGLVNGQHVWILPGWLPDGWWNDSKCIDTGANSILKYIFTVDAYPGNSSDAGSETATGKSPKDFHTEYKNCVGDATTEGDRLMYYMYDAVVAGALALDSTEEELLNKSKSLRDNFSYKSNITDMIVKSTKDLAFTGVSGKINFTASSSREGLLALYQYRYEDNTWKQRLIAIYDPSSSTELAYLDGEMPMWGTKDGKPPLDRSREQRRHLLDTPEVVYFFTFLTVVVMVMVIAFLIFTLVTWRMKAMSEAAPYMVMVILIGCLLLLVASFLLGYVDKVGLPDTNGYDQREYNFTVICNVRLWLFTVGFTLSFGALFSKVWQAYRVYTNNALKESTFSPWSFFFVIGLFLGFDILFLFIWTMVGQFHEHPKHQLRYKDMKVDPTNISEDDTIYFYEECSCDNLAYWAGGLLVYKVLIIVFGFFLAYESRNVRYRYLADSNIASYAMFATFGVILLFGITSLPLVIIHQILAGYIFLMLLVLTPITVASLILFLPRFYCLYKKYDTMLKLAKDRQSELAEVEGVELGRHNSTSLDTSSGGRVTLTSYATNSVNANPNQCLIPEGEDDKNSTSTDSGTATADNESFRRPSVQSADLPSNQSADLPSIQESPGNRSTASNELIHELV